MQIVIDIPKSLYKDIKEAYSINIGEKYIGKIIKAIINGTVLPENPTNGDMIVALFPVEIKYIFEELNVIVIILNGKCKTFDLAWWNAPYKEVINANSN